MTGWAVRREGRAAGICDRSQARVSGVRTRLLRGPAVAALLSTACAGPADRSVPSASSGASAGASPSVSWTDVQELGDRVTSVDGLSGPEAVRYDAEQDVWFVSNFGPGSVEERDGDGFVTRVDAATGAIEELRFAVGIEAQPLHMPRGMSITGDTLWVADVDGVHGFHRRTGAPLGFHDFRRFEPGFLNDIAEGPEGALYVTDTGRSSLFRIAGGQVVEVLADTALGRPNGVTWAADRNAFVLVPWEPGHTIRLWAPGEPSARPLGGMTPGRLDGVENVDDRLVVASQTDSTLLVVEESERRVLVRLAGEPADIGIDTRRNRVAVPYVALDRMDVWRLPGR